MKEETISEEEKREPKNAHGIQFNLNVNSKDADVIREALINAGHVHIAETFETKRELTIMREFWDAKKNGNGYEYLHTGHCGPIYVNQIWSEDVSAGAYADKYWDNGCVAYGPKRMFKAEIECESPEILNSILGQIRNIVACPFDDPVKSITDKAQEELTSVINAKIVENLISENIDYISKKIIFESEKYKRYKLKHKVLYKC